MLAPPIPTQPDAVREAAPTWRGMSAPMRVGVLVVWAVFVLYLVFLLKLLLFARPPGSVHSLNLVPLASIADYLFSDSSEVKRFAIANVVGNVAAFVPLGVFLPFVLRRTGIWMNLLIVACVSVAVELIQGVFGLGASDVDDVILNSLGGLIGTLFFALVRVLLRRWTRVVAVMAVLAILVVPILYYFLFVIRLKM